jgi:hypothetical protein
MPLPLSADSLDAIPETARSAYVEKGGKFVLDVEIEDTSALKAKNFDLIGKNKTLAERAALLGDRTPDEVRADLEFAAQMREKKARDAGDFETLKGEMVAKHQAALDAATGKTSKVEGKLFDVLGKREAEKEIVALGIKAKVLLPHVLPHIKVVEIDGEYEAIVVDAKGKPRIVDGQATPMSIKDLVAEIAADPEFDGVVPASGANGGGARNAPGDGGRTGVVLIPKDADVQTYRRMKDDAEKRGVPYKVAS